MKNENYILKQKRRSIIKDKKGDLTGILYFVAMIAAFAFFLLIVGFIGSEISTKLKDKIGTTTEINESLDTTKNIAENTLSAVWFIMFGGLILGLLVTSWFIPSQPIFVPIFIFLLVVAIIVGVGLSNAYEELYAVEQFESIANTQGSIEFMMSQLPYVALIVGIIGLIVTFAKPKSSGGAPIM